MQNQNKAIDPNTRNQKPVVKTEIQSKHQNALRVCLIDCDENCSEKLSEIGLNVTSGTFGNRVSVPNQQSSGHNCKLNGNIPTYLHEHNIAVINMKSRPPIPYVQEQHQRNGSSLVLVSKYPDSVFDPIAFNSSLAKKQLDQLLENKGVLIIFAGPWLRTTYTIQKLGNHGVIDEHRKNHSNYSFSSDIPRQYNENGQNVLVSTEIKLLNELLSKYSENTNYKTVFEPTPEWTVNLELENQKFEPLMKNSQNGIISFYRTHKYVGHIFVFPQIEQTLPFLQDLFTILPSFIPNSFPDNRIFGWIKKDAYILPNEAGFNSDMQALAQKYDADTLVLKEKINKNYIKYEYLHSLLTETGDELVITVKKYLEWLGFENISNMDELNPTIKEEDLQIQTTENLLVIEIKGIGGTSKDSECSQIGKIVTRRMRQHNSTNVHGLYIVNHQRFREPLQRLNPPFTFNQIEDAKLDKRGLLTTYQLFNLHSLIENNIMSKEEARNQLLKIGAVEFIPVECIPLGKPQGVYQNGKVITLNIDTHVDLNDELIIKRNHQYLKGQILEIQDDDKSVSEAYSGEIGFNIDISIRKTDEVFLRKNKSKAKKITIKIS
ncbi:hypothetical protein HNV12_12210 [Methanococcoides sp. SA1]|nr:hypothetical protein [Methanococcoides sp. SA1]